MSIETVEAGKYTYKVNKEKVMKLDFKEHLPLIRKAFEEKSLQMFDTSGYGASCLYAGPCAIGVCIPQEDRAHFDSELVESHGTGSSSYFRYGIFEAPEDQVVEWETLQSLHDGVVTGRRYYDSEELQAKIDAFKKSLDTLEQKYL